MGANSSTSGTTSSTDTSAPQADRN
jgi:hypothetical protein